MRLSSYVISQGDSIELLAQVLLGDRLSTSALIQVNKLRYPYISDSPIDQYTGSKGRAYLTSTYLNPVTVTIDNINSIIISTGNVLFFSGGTSYGAGIVDSVSGSTITFKAPIIGSYDKATRVTVFVDQSTVTTRVLKTGDTMVYSTGEDSDSNTRYAFGTDLKLDANGFFVRENQNIATVTGESNLIQAVRMRLQTEFNTLKSHLGYGNRMFEVLGGSNASHLAGLAKHYATECVEQDERVQSVDIQDFVIDSDRVMLTLVVVPVKSQDRIVHRVEITI